MSRRVAESSLAALWACGLFALWTWPFLAHPGSHVLIDAGMPSALVGKYGFANALKLELPHLNAYRFFTLPYRYNNYSFVEWFVFSPVAVLLPFPISFNCMVAMICIANGLACFLLFRYVSGSLPLGLAAAALAAWNPCTLEYLERGHVDVLMVFPLAMYLLCLMRWLDEPGVPLWGAMGWLAVMGMVYWFWIYFAMMATGLLVLERLVLRRLRLADVKRLLGAIALCAILLAPFAAGMLVQDQMHTNSRPRPPGRPFPSLAEAASIAAPYYGDFRIVRSAIPVSRFLHAVPPVLVALVILAFPLSWRSKLGWTAVFLLFLVLSWGPYPRLDGHALQWHGAPLRSPIYCAAYRYLPLFSRLHFPDRLRAVYGLAFGALLALSLRDVTRGSRAVAWLLGALIPVLLYLWAACPPAPTRPSAVAASAADPPVQTLALRTVPFRTLDLAALPRCSVRHLAGPPGAVLQMPFGTNDPDVFDWTGIYQLLRGRAVRCDYFPQFYNWSYNSQQLPRTNRLLAALTGLSERSGDPPPPSSSDVQAVIAMGLRYVSLDRPLFYRVLGRAGGDRYDHAVRYLTRFLGPPLCQETDSAVFAIGALRSARTETSPGPAGMR